MWQPTSLQIVTWEPGHARLTGLLVKLFILGLTDWLDGQILDLRRIGTNKFTWLPITCVLFQRINFLLNLNSRIICPLIGLSCLWSSLCATSMYSHSESTFKLEERGLRRNSAPVIVSNVGANWKWYLLLLRIHEYNMTEINELVRLGYHNQK